MTTTMNPAYRLWFVNRSGRAGKACVYLDPAGVTFNMSLIVLAWMVVPANNEVRVRFDWQLDYYYIWVQYSPKRAQQPKPAYLGSSIALTKNQFGLTFGMPAAGQSGTLSVLQDSSIPSGTSTVAGIGFHAAGTYAGTIGPNLNFNFKPADKPTYQIGFGDLTFDVGDSVDLSQFSSQPGSVTFPPNVFVMTATLNDQNLWTIQQGDPLSPGLAHPARKAGEVVVYEAGKGVVGIYLVAQ